MVLCGLCTIFRKNKKNEFQRMLEESQSRDIILNELNLKIDAAEADYTTNPTAENMLKCISAKNMQNKYLQNYNNNIMNKNNKIKLCPITENNDDEDLC